MATKKAKPKKLSDKELAVYIRTAYQTAGYKPGGIWHHLAEAVRRLTREGKL